jgi:hypothetical protein
MEALWIKDAGPAPIAVDRPIVLRDVLLPAGEATELPMDSGWLEFDGLVAA